MVLPRILALLAAAMALAAAPDIFPLKDVRAGQHGVGKTVFSGTRVEEFQVEVLGVLDNIGPQQSIILARLSGGPLANTGVMQGMSGSPVYIDGRLAGAVALGFPDAKEAIAGIRPIEEMLRVDPETKPLAIASIPARAKYAAGGMRLEEIATPVSFAGFTAAALEHFAPQLRALGMDPRQGVSGGGNPPPKFGDPKTLEPGSMISVQLLSGDMNVSADGTITTIDGNKLYAFGHRFLATGPTSMPFARSEVLALLPATTSSFKISKASEWMGSITADRDTAISGITGRAAALTPIEIKMGANTYHMNVVQDPIMTPIVAQMAVFSAIDSTQRAVGPATYSLRGHADFEGGQVRLDNVYSGDLNVAAGASLGVAAPLSYALTSGFDLLRLKSLTLDITPLDVRKQLQIADVAAPRTVRPGEDLEISIVLSGQNGAETIKKTHYRVPVGAPAGPLFFTVSDASSANLVEYQNAFSAPARSAAQVFGLLNALRSGSSAYLKVWRADNTFTIEGRDLPDPPASMAMIFNRAQLPGSSPANTRGAKLAEIEIPIGDTAVGGSKTIQVEVKE
ncbi:MAG TPA: SpoIVB peptidase S55 domain-containing protein [Bryobacteraceae bacterium]